MDHKKDIRDEHEVSERLKFEEAMEKLEKLVGDLEKRELSLEESLRYFQEAVELSRHCREMLAEAEYQVQYVLKEEGWTEVTTGEKEENHEG